MAEVDVPSRHHDALVEALTAYLQYDTGLSQIRATDYVVTVAGIDLESEDGRVHYTTAYTGAPHVRLGLVEILTSRIVESALDETE